MAIEHHLDLDTSLPGEAIRSLLLWTGRYVDGGDWHDIRHVLSGSTVVSIRGKAPGETGFGAMFGCRATCSLTFRSRRAPGGGWTFELSTVAASVALLSAVHGDALLTLNPDLPGLLRRGGRTVISPDLGSRGHPWSVELPARLAAAGIAAETAPILPVART
ncbi:hypothetical protein [Methylobacterium oryzisoli]|uniref:hypothetical protein n=1 Tax=Methylobacterium oryzisoli TaxID=3385502 RepID=UPI003891F620